jgi:PAS domain S-box-containing protein
MPGMNVKIPRSISIVLLILVLIITFLAVYSISLETQKSLKGAVQDKLISVATVMSSQIDGDEFVQIKTGEEDTPRFVHIRDQLRHARLVTPDIQYIYTMRKNGDTVEFVVDGDYGYEPDSARIGDLYPEAEPELILGFLTPTVNRDFTTDEWGTVLSGFSPIRDRSGTVVGIVGVDMDSTVFMAVLNQANLVVFLIGILAMIAVMVGILGIENRRAEYDRKIGESEKKFKDFVELLPQTIFETDDKGTITSTNRFALETFGFTNEEFQGGINGLDMLVPEDRERAAFFLAALLRGERPGGTEYTAKRKDGSAFPVMIYADTIVHDNRSVGIRGVLLDITDRKQTEEKLESRVRERTEQLAESVLKLEAEISHRKVTELELSRTNEELTAAYEELVGTDQALREGIREVNKSQLALEQARKKLNLLNTLTFQDIRSAIFTLSAYLGLVQMGLVDETLKKHLEKSGLLIQKIVGSLNFAKNYQDMGIHEPRWQNVNHVFVFAISHLPPLEMVRKIRVHNLEIYADPLLENAFLSLVENVLKHGGDVTELNLGYEETETGLTLIFEDDGAGIPKEEKEKIFERGFGKNTGLGLFLCREILSITGITIKETGRPGKGARFEIVVPEGFYRFNGTDEKTPDK